VLVWGPSGTGKELVARAIHGLSDRKSRRLVARNAATLPETLIAAELFGNAKNYPNPGMAERPGLIGQADGSTLFLDEIGELPVASQAQLLRVLDEGEYHRLGESAARRADLRLVAATNRDLAVLKHDLLARLNFRLEVPPLDARRDDVPLIVRHIVRRSARAGDPIARQWLADGDPMGQPRLPIDAMRALIETQYELNVRELESTLWKLLASPELMTRPAERGADRLQQPPQSAETPDPEVGELTAERIQRCLDENNGVLELTWRALGMKNRFVLVRAIKKYGLVVGRRPGQGPLRRSTRDR
jgi:transcriptional regulator with GAF, ATPase, and Fis domain